MNMGPVRGRSQSPIGSTRNTQEEDRAASNGYADNQSTNSGDLRRRLAELADTTLRDCPDSDTSPALHEQRLTEVRDRIARGYYSRPETKKAIAEKLFESLDL